MSAFPTTTPTRLTPSATVAGLCICNRDGTPRWLWPERSRRPVFLEFYTPTTWKQRAFVAGVRLIFFLGLQRLVFEPTRISPMANVQGEEWAVFTGTPGPNRKTIVVRDADTIVKIPKTQFAQKNTEVEASMLRKLANRSGTLSFRFPKVFPAGRQALAMEKLSHTGTWSQFQPQHVEALSDLLAIDGFRDHIGNWMQWPVIESRLKELHQSTHPDIPASLTKRLAKMVSGQDKMSRIEFGLAHGDFTSWNTLKCADDQLGIIDWELAKEAMPAGFDFFHFHLQQGIMVERKGWSDIYRDIHSALEREEAVQVFGCEDPDLDLYLRLYLAYHVSYYLSLYNRQDDWHEQIFWQLDVWSDALTALMPNEDARKQLITRVFDALRPHPYAALKLDQEDPTKLSVYSDLDVLVRRQDVPGILRSIRQFPHIANCTVKRRSFMVSLFIVLRDGQVLSLDLIWKIKRKATVFMDAEQMITNARTNHLGIRIVSEEDTRQYIGLFYGLNGSPLPAKYSWAEAETKLPELQENRGIRLLGNRMAYGYDSLRSLVGNPGYVITFSGVDGAGKSTVIDQVTTLVDKKFRRPVKYLRHRPSLLPILSAYVHGKEGAEQRSVSSLPRTGTNNSFWSSLLRFGYYYIDYTVGQWYVHLRYVRRGYVVIYDRYYYDFILDARRSNIALPGWVTRSGLQFLLKPNYNFFLFADPDIILKRKKELDRETIVSLTAKYRSLFAECASKYPNRVFTSLENIHLEETLASIDKIIRAGK